MHSTIIQRLRKRADNFCSEWTADLGWYQHGGGQQRRQDAELLREAADTIASLWIDAPPVRSYPIDQRGT